MTVLLVAVLDDIRFGLRRTGNAQALAQAQWYALGSEELARARIHQLDGGDGRTTLEGGWNGKPFVFPIEAARCASLDATECSTSTAWRRTVSCRGASTRVQYRRCCMRWTSLPAGCAWPTTW